MEAEYEVVKLSPLRKVIAARMIEAKQTIPHYRLTADIEMDALLALHKRQGAEARDVKLSVNDFLIKACAATLMQSPDINIQFVDNEIRRFAQADISVVVAVEGGLSTPVLRGADKKSVYAIAREMKDLATRATNGTLKMDEIEGGSFSISNLGMYEVDQFDAIINSPQGAILAIGGARPQLAPGPDGTARTATIMRATLSCDHRVIDGVQGAAFLQKLREQIAAAETLLI